MPRDFEILLRGYQNELKNWLVSWGKFILVRIVGTEDM